jgi:hypothetical protein
MPNHITMFNYSDAVIIAAVVSLRIFIRVACGFIVASVIYDYQDYSSLKRIVDELRSENDSLRCDVADRFIPTTYASLMNCVGKTNAFDVTWKINSSTTNASLMNCVAKTMAFAIK